mmetsp:Transcript_28135/g.77475  ORF Transcript_28135/g.77475 Transcript_28135/m.77475 type:complete len:80 (-) Transcript_28135:123-362(-)
MSPRIIAHLLSDKIHKSTKEFLLSSPTFHRFARESSARAQDVFQQVVRAAQPAVEKATQKGQEAYRHLEKQASQAVGKK